MSTFARDVRHALTHLYDPDALQSHPLLARFGLSRQPSSLPALREALIRAIDELKPAPSIPPDSRAWRIYRVLVCRYVQQLDQEQTADQLGVGVRHVRREQNAAVEALAAVLSQKYQVSESSTLPRESDLASQFAHELAWVRGEDSGESCVAEVIQATARLVAPLLADRDVNLDVLPLPVLAPVALHPTILRQAMVSAVTYATRRAPGGAVRLGAEQHGRQILVRITATSEEGLTVMTPDQAKSLAAAQALLRIQGSSLDVAEAINTLKLTLAVPVVGTISVLLVDDNADFAQLFGRYLARTRYQMRWIAGVDHLFKAIDHHRPEVIVLDVMIPGIDGWEILGRLRQHPQTSDLPIVVCTIVPERELALALGATAFLAKPVMRPELLTTLGQAIRESY
ncbi:MAG TPA: response regulator [Chloroflexota bacterium]|nr:response regulator [Chloroflexota bacterium]